jgi:acyl carrier protein
MTPPDPMPFSQNMQNSDPRAPAPERAAILTLVRQTVTEMLCETDREITGPLEPQTQLVADLAYSSLDIVMLIGYLNQQLGLVDLPFERLLFIHGRPVPDVSLEALADFMWEQMQQSSLRPR